MGSDNVGKVTIVFPVPDNPYHEVPVRIGRVKVFREMTRTPGTSRIWGPTMSGRSRACSPSPITYSPSPITHNRAVPVRNGRVKVFREMARTPGASRIWGPTMSGRSPACSPSPITYSREVPVRNRRVKVFREMTRTPGTSRIWDRTMSAKTPSSSPPPITHNREVPVRNGRVKVFREMTRTPGTSRIWDVRPCRDRHHCVPRPR